MPFPNIFYFVRRFPLEHWSSIASKNLSLIQSMSVLKYSLYLASDDLTPENALGDLSNYPIKFLHINPLKIAPSLFSAKVKPSLVFFGDYQMQKLYSIFLYSKWNKTPRVLEVNKISELEQWRRQNYVDKENKYIVRPQMRLYPEIETCFGVQEKASINRSDYLLSGNDFISYLLKKEFGAKKYSQVSFGLPINQYNSQINELSFADYHQRKNFLFIGNMFNEHSKQMFDILVDHIWPLIRKELPQAELHIYNSGFHEKVKSRKNQLTRKKILLMGVMEQAQQICYYRAMLYPAKWSAGLKGSVIEAWFNHTPVVTTPVGAIGHFQEALQAKFSGDDRGLCYEGFFNERKFSPEQVESQNRVKQYYDSNIIGCEHLSKLNFGGLFQNYSYEQFAKSAIEIYTNKDVWTECLKKSRTCMRKNQASEQMEVNLRYGIAQAQMSAALQRKGVEYLEEWNRYIKSKEAHTKLQSRKH